MALDIAEVVAYAADIILLTFVLVWRERQKEREKPGFMDIGLPPLPGDD